MKQPMDQAQRRHAGWMQPEQAKGLPRPEKKNNRLQLWNVLNE